MTPTDHIVATVRDAQPGLLELGRDWYPAAHAAAETLSAGTPYTVRQCADVIAALSPRNPWAKNLEHAATAVDAHRAGRPMPTVGLRQNMRWAWAILNGATLEDVCKGPKVRTFARAIMGDTDAVVVDVWAARAAGLERTTFTPNQYAAAVDAYRAAAAILALTPRETQACAWVAIRGRAD